MKRGAVKTLSGALASAGVSATHTPPWHGAGWGRRDYYPGGMAEYCQVWRQNLYPVPDSVSDEDAKAAFPDGWDAPKPYLRIVPQPK